MPTSKKRRESALSRRAFLQSLGWMGVGGAIERGANLLATAQAAQKLVAKGTPAFQIVPASASGIGWVHTNGASPEYYLPETEGPGCAFFDYDNDGWMDIYLVNSGPCDFYTPKTPLRNALYRNNRNGTFTDVTEKAGVTGNAFGMGCAVGDYDGDGFADLYVTQYPHSILYHNNGDGTFTDVTQKAGVAAPGWATSAVWFDYDNDGKLDLFVCRFADFDKEKNQWCGNRMTGSRMYCIPSVYHAMPSYLFHNNGDGTFTNVSRESGIGEMMGKAWGVVACDINNDGWMDLFVSNDTVANFLYANQGKGKFDEIGLLAGVAYGAYGNARSGMGVDAADYDQDGWIDLFVANIDHEVFSLYHNNGNETFTDVAASMGIAMPTLLMSGWGAKFFDYDNDGEIDLIIANGHPDTKIHQRVSDVYFREEMLLFRNNGKKFVDVSASSGAVFSERIAGRGLALGDFDNDGAVDVLVGVNGEAPILLHNRAGRENHWLGVRLVGKKANRDAIGAKITYQAGGLKRHRTKVGGGSYISSHDPRMVLGIGQRTKMDWIEIQWPQPSGLVQRIANPPIDRYITITEGEAKFTTEAAG